MRPRPWSFCCLLLAAMAPRVAQADVAAVVMTAPPPGYRSFNPSVPWTVGFQFRVGGQQDIAVTRLGVYDYQNNGLGSGHRVALWDPTASTSTPIASVTVPSGASGELLDGYRYVALGSTVALTAGKSYVIGAEYYQSTDNMPLYSPASTSFTAPIQVQGGRFTNNYSGGAPSYPGSFDTAYYLGPNLRFDVQAVPEPGPLVLMGLTAAAGGIWAGVQRRRGRRRPSPSR